MGSFSSKDIHIPSTADLYEALENILWFWPGVFVQLVKENQAPPVLDLSRAVRLTGQHEGLVILKSSEALGGVLAKALLEDRPTSPEDAFSEFSNMFCGHIMNKIRASEKVAFRHFLPLPASDFNPPSRAPEARMTVAIESVMLDVQLWINSDSLLPEKA